jgi:hypothetical protein
MRQPGHKSGQEGEIIMFTSRFNYRETKNRRNGDKTTCNYNIKNTVDGQKVYIGYDEELEELCIASEQEFFVTLHFEEYFAEDNETVVRDESRTVDSGADTEKTVEFLHRNYEVREVIL